MDAPDPTPMCSSSGIRGPERGPDQPGWRLLLLTSIGVSIDENGLHFQWVGAVQHGSACYRVHYK
jgi:hypothetical protein